MTYVVFLPVAVVALFPAAAFLQGRLNRAAQPLRLELAEKGERLLASADLPREVRDQVSFMLETAFGFGWTMLAAVVTGPFVAIAVALFRPDILARALRDFSALTPEQGALFYDVLRLHDRITSANHPVLNMLLELEYLGFMLVTLIVIAISAKPLPSKLDRAVVLNVLEMSEARLFHRRPTPAHALTGPGR